MKSINALLIEAYVSLAHPDNQYKSRHTADGQKLLADLRDEIVKITGINAEEVQNFDFLESEK